MIQMNESDMWFFGLTFMLGVSLLVGFWLAHESGKNQQKAENATAETKRLIEEIKVTEEIKQESKESANEAISAGNFVSSAPVDPNELPPEVRARIFKRKT